jgi:hypothetical protein
MPESPQTSPAAAESAAGHLQAATALLAGAGRQREDSPECLFDRNDTPPLMAAMSHAVLAMATELGRLADEVHALRIDIASGFRRRQARYTVRNVPDAKTGNSALDNWIKGQSTPRHPEHGQPDGE